MTLIDSDYPNWADYEKANPIIVPRDLENPHLITRMTAAAKGWEIPEPFDADHLTRSDWFNADVFHTDTNRVLRLIDALLKACEARGFELRHVSDGDGIAVIVDGEAIELKLSQQRGRPYRLYLQAGGKTWNDTFSRPLERRLNNVMLALRSAAAWYISDRQREEKMAEMERQRVELRQQVTEERANVDGLFAEAENWQKAKNLRAYIAAVEALPAKRKDRKQRAAWVSWAQEQADRLDPLVDSPPSILDTPKRLYRELGQFEILNEDGSIERIFG